MQNQIDSFKMELKNEIHSSMHNQINTDKNELRSDISNQTNELRNMMASFFQKNTASTLSSGSLPSNTIANPRGDLKAITTRSGISYDGTHIHPLTSSLPKVVERVPEMTKDTVILKKLPEKLGDLDKFLIPCDFLELDECLALADLGASINLMPLSIWRKFSLPELTPTQIILELTNRSTTRPAGIAEVIFVKVGKFHFPIDFVVVDYVVEPRVPLILGRPFLRTGRALVDVYGEELTLRVNDEAISFKVGQTLKNSYNDAESINQIDVIGVACDEYVQETFLQTPDELSNLDDDYYDTEGDILYLEKLLNEDPSPNLPLVMIGDLKKIDATMTKPSIEKPPELELKELPFHLEYAFLEGTEKLPVIISKELKDEEKFTLLKVLKSHKRAITWKISDIKGIDPRYCTHKILMDDDFKPVVQHQRRVNPKIHELIKKEVIKLPDARLIYPIFDSPW
nr:reverse transcriptase domain-containing protein [Tanacetum cinerariifolium]